MDKIFIINFEAFTIIESLYLSGKYSNETTYMSIYTEDYNTNFSIDLPLQSEKIKERFYLFIKYFYVIDYFKNNFKKQSYLAKLINSIKILLIYKLINKIIYYE